MKWEDYQKILSLILEHKRDELVIDIQCPNCERNIHRKKYIILTSDPLKCYYECNYCGWHDFGF